MQIIPSLVSCSSSRMYWKPDIHRQSHILVFAHTHTQIWRAWWLSEVFAKQQRHRCVNTCITASFCF